MKEIPKREAFFKPVLQALVELGGSGTNDEINNKVISLMNIPEIILNIMHGDRNRILSQQLFFFYNKELQKFIYLLFFILLQIP